MVRISSLSKEYLRVPVSTDVEPLADEVEFAFTDGAEPEEADWSPAGWEPGGPPYQARALVGPGGDFELDDGLWFVWVRITHGSEVPVMMAGFLEIT